METKVESTVCGSVLDRRLLEACSVQSDSLILAFTFTACTCSFTALAVVVVVFVSVVHSAN